MKKKSKRFREISKNVVRDKKFNINDAIELVKKMQQQNLMSQLMCP